MNRRRTRIAMKGGGLPAPLVKKLLSESYNTKKGMKDIDDYKIDRELSGERVQVYHNDANKQHQCRVVGSGTPPERCLNKNEKNGVVVLESLEERWPN